MNRTGSKERKDMPLLLLLGLGLSGLIFWATRRTVPAVTAVSGLVYDVTPTEGILPIVGAVVTIGTYSATTENDGRYRIELPPGDYEGTCVAGGYFDELLTLSVPPGESTFDIGMPLAFQD
jgi:hypothetical protein